MNQALPEPEVVAQQTGAFIPLGDGRVLMGRNISLRWSDTDSAAPIAFWMLVGVMLLQVLSALRPKTTR